MRALTSAKVVHQSASQGSAIARCCQGRSIHQWHSTGMPIGLPLQKKCLPRSFTMMSRDLTKETTVSVALQAGMIGIKVNDASAVNGQNLVVLPNGLRPLAYRYSLVNRRLRCFRHPIRLKSDRSKQPCKRGCRCGSKCLALALAAGLISCGRHCHPTFRF